jgi:hypothetical protein
VLYPPATAPRASDGALAACAGSGVPAPAPPRRWGTARPCSRATSSRPTMPRTHWTPSPCGRLSRPPRWVVTPTTTTGPPPCPGGDGGRCACPEPEGFGGHRRNASHIHSYTGGRVGAQLYPGGIAARHRTTPRGLARPISKRAGETVPNSYRDRAPQQPIAASSGLVTGIGAPSTGIGFPTRPAAGTHGRGDRAADPEAAAGQLLPGLLGAAPALRAGAVGGRPAGLCVRRFDPPRRSAGGVARAADLALGGQPGVCIEQNDAWLVGRRYLSAGSVEPLLEAAPLRRQRGGERAPTGLSSQRLPTT